MALQRLKEEEEWRLKLKQKEEHILKAKEEEEEKALWLAQERERVKEEKEQNEKEEQEEQEQLPKLVEETWLCLEEEAAAKAKAEAVSEPKPEEREKAELEAHKGDGKQDRQLEDGKDVDTETLKTMEDGKDKLKDSLRINTASVHSPTSDKWRPGPLDLTSATRSASPIVMAFATARVIADIATVSYPEGYHSPHPDLNQNVKNRKFRYQLLSLKYLTIENFICRYDHEFLLKFMSVCKERPATLPPLDAIGLKPVDHTHTMTRGRSGYHHPSSAVPPSCQASIGLGFNPSALGKPGASNLFSMGNFSMMGADSKLSSEEQQQPCCFCQWNT